jgi:hypothetical protein
VRRALERIEIPGEHEARERAWAVVQAAHAGREPQPRSRTLVRPLLVACALAAAVAAALSPPGRAVIEDVREVIGVESAEPALFSLPTEGRVLSVSPGTAWIVHGDGSSRLLGPYRGAAWSPFGRFVVGTTRLQLATLEPDGDKRWSLARRDVRRATWGGTRTDTRIAYLAGTQLHVVGGDGRGDTALIDAPSLPRSPLAWQPGRADRLAYVVDDVLRVVSTRARGEEAWSVDVPGPLVSLEWSDDGSRLLALSRRQLAVFVPGRAVSRTTLPRGTVGVAAAFEPGSRRIATVVYSPRLDRSDLRLGARVLFSGSGRFTGLAWSPDAEWLLVPWRDADQWVFVSTDGSRRIRAVSRVSAQFDGFPRVEGWIADEEE